MFIVAVTGNIATGKSIVSNVFSRNGVPVVDADKIAREILEPGKPCWLRIREEFGDQVLLPDKQINRILLGHLIFSYPELRGKLNRITHPIIHRKIFIQVFKYFMSGHAWIVLDLPLLFETGILMDFIHKIITVTCDEDKQLQRLMKRSEHTQPDAMKRIQSQMSIEKKCEKSHFVIDNNGTIEDTEAAAFRIFQMMQTSKQHWLNRISLLGLVFAITFIFYMLNKTLNFWPKALSVKF